MVRRLFRVDFRELQNMPTAEDAQRSLDRDDAIVRLNRLVDALVSLQVAKENLRLAELQHRRAKQALKMAEMKATELSMIERRARLLS